MVEKTTEQEAVEIGREAARLAELAEGFGNEIDALGSELTSVEKEVKSNARQLNKLKKIHSKADKSAKAAKAKKSKGARR